MSGICCPTSLEPQIDLTAIITSLRIASMDIAEADGSCSASKIECSAGNRKGVWLIAGCRVGRELAGM